MTQPPAERSAAPLSPRQRELLRYIRDVWRVQGRPPTERCIVEYFTAVGRPMCLRTVQEHLAMLYRKGWLRSPTPAGLRCLHIPQ